VEVVWEEMREAVLVVGGAGYIGSHTSYLLYKNGYHVVIIDKLVHSQSWPHFWGDLYVTDFVNESVLNFIFSNYRIIAVMHFAANIEVGKSVINPKIFYDNNVIKTLLLLEFLLTKKVKRFIFSSSCAVYGVPMKIPIKEIHPLNPYSPYGKNKLAVEFALQDYAQAYDFSYVSLRYFNAAGSLYQCGLGENHQPETHIIPLLIRAQQQNLSFRIFGTDYDTPDGTCIRDYIHVLDIAQAHVLALEYLLTESKSDVFNLGSGCGYSVHELIKTLTKLTEKSIKVVECERREGDVGTLLADSSKAHEKLNWNVKHSMLHEILKSALCYENSKNRLKSLSV
jgi:UDP-glucose 4-epimerase